MRERIEEKLRQADDFFTVDGMKRNWDILAIVAIFVMAVWLRYLPAGTMQYIQALDPYLGFRWSQHLAYEGSLPTVDFMRYFPYAYPIHHEQLGAILFPAVFYWMGPFLVFSNYLAWAQFYPALMGGLAVVFAYLFGKEMWNRTAGVSGAFFLATIAGSMQRTGAGWFIKEAGAVMFMMASLYFFIRAWKRDDWLSGIISGLALAGLTITWGGYQMVWLLYPMTVGIVLLLDEDIDQLIKAYTPVVILGGGIAAVLNPSRFWFTGDILLANLALLGFLWSRKVVEEFKLIDKDYLSYYAPGMSLLGLVALALSPLYSDFIASQVSRFMRRALRSGGDTIAGTVAENQPVTLAQLVSQFGALPAGQVQPLLSLPSGLIGPWTFSFLAVAFLCTAVGFMLLRKYQLIDGTIDDTTYYYGFGVALLAWFLAFALFFEGSVIFAVGPALIAALAGMVFVHSFSEYGEREIEMKWYYLLPFFWVLTNIIAAVNMNRLVFLASFPVAITAGYMLSIVIEKLSELDLSEIFESLDQKQAWTAAVLIVLVPVVTVNVASGYASAQGISGSPNSLWMESLEWMESETEPGETILSWWDYGYHFQTIGRSASTADGGNAGYFSDQPNSKLPYPIADFLTSNEPLEHRDLFEKHSVDYLVLDNSMIGKYSAVSQIANRDNEEFESMIQIGNHNLRDVLSEDGDRAVAAISDRGIQVYTPLSITDESVEIVDAPTLDTGRERVPVDCVLTDDGRVDFDTDRSAEYCVAEDPYFSFERSLSHPDFPARVVLVPKDIADSSLVRLYLMDGYDMDFVEKVPEASNDYIKVWEVDLE